MAKRSVKTAPESPVAPFHSPFAGLGALREALPAPRVEVLPAPATPSPVAAPREEPRPRSLGKLVLQREKKGRGGKTVTRVRGLPADELERLASDLKRALGCGASIEDGDVLLLGDLVGRAGDWLEAHGASRVVRGN